MINAPKRKFSASNISIVLYGNTKCLSNLWSNNERMKYFLNENISIFFDIILI